MRRNSINAFFAIWIVAVLIGCDAPSSSLDSGQNNGSALPSEIHVFAGQSIQAALDRAAECATVTTVVVHEGVYAPPEHRQALVWFNARHDGLHLKAHGDVTLTAANATIAQKGVASYPAVVNHVVYFGDGVGTNTRLSGFTITGANNYVTTKSGPPIEPDIQAPRLKKTSFFYTDGGGIKVFGRSYPTLENLNIVGNDASPCGAGLSVEHRGYVEHHVTVRDCVFQNNRTPLAGSAITLLGHEYGSSIVVENCLFVSNLSNGKLDVRSRRLGSWKPDVGHGAVTVFAHSKAEFSRCTFFANRNGVDDLSPKSIYRDSIFWQNAAGGGWAEGETYDVDLTTPNQISGSFLSSNSYRVDPASNMLQAPDPEFDAAFNPQNSAYGSAGYRSSLRNGLKLNNDDAKQVEQTANVSLSQPEAAAETLEIDICGKEFGWNITYADRATGADVTVRRHLYVPVGTRVLLNIKSSDYLYQLALPQQSVREVAVPGMTHQSRFTTRDVGVFPLVGDQFCGYTHPDLIGKLIVKEKEEFRQWLENQK